MHSTHQLHKYFTSTASKFEYWYNYISFTQTAESTVGAADESWQPTRVQRNPKERSLEVHKRQVSLRFHKLVKILYSNAVSLKELIM